MLAIPLKTLTLFVGIAKLVIAVGQLDRADENLETFGYARIARVKSGKRRLAGWVAVDNRDGVGSEAGLYTAGKQPVKQAVAIPAVRRIICQRRKGGRIGFQVINAQRLPDTALPRGEADRPVGAARQAQMDQLNSLFSQ